MGAVVILAGVAGMLMKSSKPKGGGGTAFLMALSALGFLAAVLSVVMGDGLSELPPLRRRRSRLGINYMLDLWGGSVSSATATRWRAMEALARCTHDAPSAGWRCGVVWLACV